MGYPIDAACLFTGTHQHDWQCTVNFRQLKSNAIYCLDKVNCFTAFADIMGLVVY